MSMKGVLKWAGMAAGGLVLLVLLVLGGAMGFTKTHQSQVYTFEVAPLQPTAEASEAEMLELGRRLVLVRGCADCHKPDLGGDLMLEDPAIGRLTATNLTRGEGGIASQYTDADWIRAIRHGVSPAGRALVFMPSHEFYPIGDDDLAAMIAYIKSVPPVDRVHPANRVGPIAALLHVMGKMPLLPARMIDHTAPRPVAPAPGVTVDYGEYLATGCVGCHGAGFAGGRIPGSPPDMPIPTNITPDPETGLAAWDQSDFIRLMREGVRPDGSEVNPFMPVQFTKEFTDMELEAMWLYLRGIEPRSFGQR
jgi:mono/diheme cytochrome c family protein